MTRAKNVGNIMAKNLADMCVGALAFFAFGYGIAFGTDAGSLFGTDGFFLSGTFTTFGDGLSTPHVLLLPGGVRGHGGHHRLGGPWPSGPSSPPIWCSASS